MKENLQDYSHKRYNILTGDWVLVSPHRTKRPWQGFNEKTSEEERISYDVGCYLCPTNTRANGEVNPDYKDVFVFENDFAALQKKSKTFSINNGLLKAQSEKGICKVICFSSDHSKSLAELEIQEIKRVIQAWQKEFKELGKESFVNYVQIFENKGAIMGCSNSHPHGQIWSQSSLPNEVEKKDKCQLTYYQDNKRSLLADYLKQEQKAQERVVFENSDFLVLIPFWAVWPYETMIAPKIAQSDIAKMSLNQTGSFAEAISVITKVYDKLFSVSFPYSSGIHQAPTNGKENLH